MDIKKKFEKLNNSTSDNILEKIIDIKFVGGGKGLLSKEDLQAANEKVAHIFEYYSTLEGIISCVMKINPCQSSVSEYI